MEIKNKKPLPLRCRFFCREIKKCGGKVERACYNCDYALNRFIFLDDDGNKIEFV
jgi:hypothetical protein